jgi:hypothetical protein
MVEVFIIFSMILIELRLFDKFIISYNLEQRPFIFYRAALGPIESSLRRARWYGHLAGLGPRPGCRPAAAGAVPGLRVGDLRAVHGPDGGVVRPHSWTPASTTWGSGPTRSSSVETARPTRRTWTATTPTRTAIPSRAGT